MAEHTGIREDSEPNIAPASDSPLTVSSKQINLSAFEAQSVAYTSNIISSSVIGDQGQPLSDQDTDRSSSSLTSVSTKPRSNEPSLLAAALRLQTQLPQYTVTPSNNNNEEVGVSANIPDSSSIRSLSLKSPYPSHKAGTSTPGIASLTPSALTSPALGPLADITPLPSPLAGSESPNPFNRTPSRPGSRGSEKMSPDSAFVTANGESISSALANSQQRKAYTGLLSAAKQGDHNQEMARQNVSSHAKNRSISEYVPDPIQIMNRPRKVTVSGTSGSVDQNSPQLRREEHLAEKRGLVSPVTQEPTPPPSTQGQASSLGSTREESGEPVAKRRRYYDARGVKDHKRRRWRAVRLLGEGTFSKVYLATSQESWAESIFNDHETVGLIGDVEKDERFDTKRAVAIKVAQHGAAGGADELKIRNGLRRELDILKSVHHPSVVHLKAFKIEEERSIFVMSLCAGGDLFELASQKRNLLTPSIIQRIFAEIVGATRYLHDQLIIHRDIKLENVLVNIPYAKFSHIANWQTHPFSLITLTDMGLSKRIDPAHPLDDTRCGSEEYCAPEIVMGQDYDGRKTDAWALGVLLYGILESRLPFDPMPGLDENDYNIQLSRTKHRIARIEYLWVKFGDEDGDPGDFGKLDGARIAIQSLLKRATRRATLQDLADQEWVKNGINVPHGIRFKEEHEPEEM